MIKTKQINKPAKGKLILNQGKAIIKIYYTKDSNHKNKTWIKKIEFIV